MMARNTVEGPGGTQATHSATNPEFGDISEDLGTETRNTGLRDDIGMDDGYDVRARIQARASRAVEVGSDYLRNHDIDEMRSDLEREIRAHPIKSIALALGAGYVLGRLFR
jgi:hypothetical protein